MALTLRTVAGTDLPEDHPVRHGLGEPAFSNVMGVWWADLLVAL